jgi:hypothetical protein
MNKEKVKIYLENVMTSVEEECDPIQVCPLCEKPASIISENEEFVTLECTNWKCKIRTYAVTLD